MDSLASSRNVFPLIRDMRPDTWEALNQHINGQDNAVRISVSSSYIEWQSHAPVAWKEMEFLDFERRQDFEKALDNSSAVAFFERYSVKARLHSS
ncbi:hypothetical protein BKM77_11065 [Pseudomonas syringae]|nr:hypothetical protein BKM77_11065 [Pseudomonas syringae]